MACCVRQMRRLAGYNRTPPPQILQQILYLRHREKVMCQRMLCTSSLSMDSCSHSSEIVFVIDIADGSVQRTQAPGNKIIVDNKRDRKSLTSLIEAGRTIREAPPRNCKQSMCILAFLPWCLYYVTHGLKFRLSLSFLTFSRSSWNFCRIFASSVVMVRSV